MPDVLLSVTFDLGVLRVYYGWPSIISPGEYTQYDCTLFIIYHDNRVIDNVYLLDYELIPEKN